MRCIIAQCGALSFKISHTLSQASAKVKWEKAENQIQVDLDQEDQSPVEEIPPEQTRVYQNQPTHPQNQATDQTQANQNLPVRVSTSSTPKTPSESIVLQKTQPNQRKKPERTWPKPDQTDMNQNWIDKDQKIPSNRQFTNSAFDGNGAIWVTGVTEQPGFLFPATRTTTQPTIRRQITEEASLSMLSPEVFGIIHFLYFSHFCKSLTIYICILFCLKTI